MKTKFHIVFFFAACIMTVRSSSAASLPFSDLADLRGPYEGTGAGGDAFYSCKLGDAWGLPVCAFWSSSRLQRSPYFGLGWSIPILESRFVPAGGGRWAFHQPDGYVRVFAKPEDGNGRLLKGGTFWKATVDGDRAAVIADAKDGGVTSRFIFHQGRLVRMICEEGDFEIRYSSGVATRIVSEGRVLLDVVRKEGEVRELEFRFPGRKKVKAYCQRSRVFGERGDSYAVLSIQETCLVKLISDVGRETVFGYSGEGDEAFFTANDDKWVWNPSTRKIVSYGDWKFSMTDPEQEWNEPLFRRKDVMGREEFYYNNRKSGIRTERFADGGERVCRVFTAGPLEGRRLRWIERKDAAGVNIRAYYAYDEKGRLYYRRATRGEDGELVETWYNGKGLMIRRRVNGKDVPVGAEGKTPAPIPSPGRSDARMSRDNTPPLMYDAGGKDEE